MAYVSVPKDMSAVKTRLIMNLSKRQVICFGIAAAIGAPLFLVSKEALGNTGSMVLMIAAVIPAFFFAIYSKDGVIPAEKYLLLVLRQKLFYPKVRVYRAKNMYSFLAPCKSTANMKEGDFGKIKNKSADKSAKTGKSRAKGKPNGKASFTRK
jgi:hypothetical protein